MTPVHRRRTSRRADLWHTWFDMMEALLGDTAYAAAPAVYGIASTHTYA